MSGHQITRRITLGEIIALEQEWLTRGPSQRVSEHVAEMGLTSLAEAPVRSFRLGYVLRVDGDHYPSRSREVSANSLEELRGMPLSGADEVVAEIVQ